MVACILDFKQFFLHLFDDFATTTLICLHFVWHVRNDQSDENLQGNDDMLNADGHEDDISTVPVVGITLDKVLSQD